MVFQSHSLQGNHTPEEHFRHFRALETAKKRSDFLSSLVPRDLLGLYSVNKYDDDENISPQLSWPPTVLDAEAEPSEKPTQRHVNLLYDSLFHMVSAAKAKAKQEDKSFQLIVGDIHGDRTALLICSMLLHIGNRLGIKQVGAEVPEEGVIRYANGYTLKGLKEQVQAIAQGKPAPELGGNAYGKTRNFDFLIEQAMQLGLKDGLFANDPAAITTDEDMELITNPETRHQRLTLRRDLSMADALNQKASTGQDCISFYGIGHLSGIQNQNHLQHNKNTSQLYISAANCYIYCDEITPFPLFKDFTLLPSDRAEAKATGQGKRDGESTLVQVWVNGDLNTKDDVLNMAKEADRAVGRKLAFLQHEPRYR